MDSVRFRNQSRSGVSPLLPGPPARASSRHVVPRGKSRDGSSTMWEDPQMTVSDTEWWRQWRALFLGDATHQVGAEERPVDLRPAAGLEDRASVRAGVALDAVLHGEQKRLEEGPVVLLGKELLQAAEELLDQLLLLLLGLRLGNAHADDAVQGVLGLGSLFLREGGDGLPPSLRKAAGAWVCP